MTPTSANGTPQQPTGLVAVIGLGCVLPDAPNVAQFWDNIRNGRSSIREVPRDRWNPDLFYSEDRTLPDKTYTKIGAFVTDFKFEPMRFRIPPTTVRSLDATQLWALEAARQCLEDSGYDKKEFDRARCAVILGNAMGGEIQRLNNYRFAWPLARKALLENPEFAKLPPAEQQRILNETGAKYVSQFPEITEDSMPGELSNVIAGRIANVFNLSGKNFTTDAACASSLAAIDAAVKTLVDGENDLVVCGGADRSMDVSTYVKFSKIGALSPTGSYPFDARADGFVMGEGCALMLLKRYEDAVRDGDKVYAVVRGVGGSSDGKGKGITAPNPDGQVKSVQRAFVDAKIPPSEVDLVECHGTSTRVGDVVEVQVLHQIFSPHVSKKQTVPIGSVKSNMGHLKSAAGAASLLKVILALHQKTLPPSINFQQPNPNIKWDETPFYVITAAKPWPEPATDRPRRAGISSFGFGGTNFHVILEEYAPGKNTTKATPGAVAQISPPNAQPIASVLLKTTQKTRTQEPLHAAGRIEVLVVGAESAAGLETEIARFQSALRSVDPRDLATLLHRQNTQAIGHPVRVAIVLDSLKDAPEKLTKALEGVREPKKRPLLIQQGIHYGQGAAPGKLAFLFPGQGSQYADMVRDLSTRFESVRRTLDDADRVMEPLVGKPLTQFLFTDEAQGRNRDAVEEALKRTEITQPAVLAADAALFRLLGDYGLKPDLVAGHSLGEYGALIAAGVLTFDDALLAVSARGREMANVHVPDLGKMASVSADAATVEAHLKNVTGYVIPANKNCKVQTVIAGASPAVDQAVQYFQTKGIQAQLIPVSAAFHSAIVAPATDPLRRVLERLDVREPKIPCLSNVHADYYATGPDGPRRAVELLAKQVAAPVEWQRQIDRAYADGARVFVEVGPKSVLTTFVKNILEGRPHFAVAANHPKKGGFFHFFDTVALLAAAGYPVRFPNPRDATVHLPAYLELAAGPSTSAPTTTTAGATQTASSVTSMAFPKAEAAFETFVREKQEELRRLLTAEAQRVAAPATPVAADPELLALKKRVEQLGLNLEPILVTGVSVGTPGRAKKLFDDANFERVFAGENAIEPLDLEEQRRQVDKNIVRLVKSDTGDHRFETIQDVAEVIKLAARRGEFDFVRDYGVNPDLAESLDITSKMAIAAGIEALRDAQIPLVRGYVKTSRGTFLPGDWALPEPLQHETGIIFASAFPGYTNLVDHLSKYLADKYARRPYRELQALYDELVNAVRDPDARRPLEAWHRQHEAELRHATQTDVFEFSRRFLFRVLSMGHAQLAQFIRAKGPNTQVNAACSSTTQAIAIAEDWIRTGRCKRVLVVGADDITNENLLEHWASGFLAAGAATTEGDVTKAALPFDKRRHGMIIGMGAVGLVVEAESVVKARGMEAIAEILATSILNSAYHGSRLDTDHVATVMDDLFGAVERRTGLSRGKIAERLLFMSHETYTPARGGSAAAEIQALTKTFGADVAKVVVANTKGFTGHPMGVGIEDAIVLRCLQTGRVPPIANLREPDASLGNIRLSQGGHYDVEYALRLAAGFGSQIAMAVFQLRSKDMKRIVEPAKYEGWLSTVSGTRNPELEVVNRTLRVKSQLPALAETAAKPAPTPAPAPTTPSRPPPAPRPQPLVPAVLAAAPTRIAVLERIVAVVAEKTGYPRDLLDPNLELEADLGIDTVKQAELFGVVREQYQVPRDDNLQIKDINTLNKIADFIVTRAPGPSPPTTSPAPAQSGTSAKPVTSAVAAPAAGATREQVMERLLALVADKTGYTRDLLDPNLELEADLGIDTVKQAEIFGIVREEFHVVRDDTLQLRDYPTLNKIVDYLHSRVPGAVAAPPPPVAPMGPSPQLARPAAGFPVAAAPGKEAVLAAVRRIVAEKTGYPVDLLEAELDLEADLGIDTVKQAELFGVVREQYQIPRDDNLQIKDINTLSKIVELIVTRAAGAPASTVVSPIPAAPTVETRAPAPPTPAPAPVSAPTLNAVAALQRVREVIAEKTGYPIDLLEPDLDLEADLGIDTVKQAELFGLLRESYGVAPDDDLQLKDYNTLRKIADFFEAQTGSASVPPATPVAKAPVTSETPLTRTTRRYVVRYVAAPASNGAKQPLDGKTLVVWAPPLHRADLVHALRNAGATALPLDAIPGKLEEAQAWVDEQRTRTPRINGIVYVPTPNPSGSEYTLDEARAVKALFWLVKALLTGAKSGEVEYVATATFLGGDFAANLTQPINPLEGGLVGLVKAIGRELPAATVKAVDFPLRVAAPTLAATLVEELGRKDGLVETGTLAGRGTLRLIEQDVVEEEPGVELSRYDVIVVSGGGAGITSDIVRDLAQQTPAAFVLLGRTALPPDTAQLAAYTPQQWNGRRVEIQAELKAKGEKVTPVAVDRVLNALKKAAEIHATVEALRATGARAEYHALDVTDAKAVEAVLHKVHRDLGPVTGLIHAAGIEESKLIVDKTSASFDRVFDVKVAGARNLLAATEPAKLRFFIAFTSIAGRFGNAGQADYSAANDALAKLCAALRVERGSSFPATAIDWSAWGEKGMATRGSIMTVLKEAGVTPIPLREGVQRLADELAHGLKDAEIIIAGELGRLAPPDAFTPRDAVLLIPARNETTTRPAPTQERVTGQQVLVVEPATDDGNLITHPTESDGRTATATLTLDPARDPYLRDHRVDGVPYLPGVFGLEAFAETAHRVHPAFHFVGARDVEFRLPAKCLRDQPLDVSIVATVATESPERTDIGCRLQSVFTNAKGERLGAPRIHFTGTLLFEPRPDAKPAAYEPPTLDVERMVEKQEIYRHYFHGPSFRVLNNIGLLADGRTTVGIWADPRAAVFAERTPRFLTAPLLCELAFQTAGAHELFRERFLSLPKAIGRLKFHQAPPAGAAVRAVATFKQLREGVAHFDVTVATTDGDLILQLQDFQLIRVRPLEPDSDGPRATPPQQIEADAAPTSVYRARWGRDLPMPLAGVVGVVVDRRALEAAHVTDQEALTSGERTDQERYRNEKRAREFFAGRLAAKEAIARLLDRPVLEARGIEIRRLETGEPQPRGAGLDDVLVSITHTGDLALAVATRRDGLHRTVGIDLERVEEKPAAFETQAFTDAERRLIDRLVAQGQTRATVQIKFWAVKEAILKALGKGFALSLHTLEIRNLDEEGRAVVALADPARRVLDDMQASHVSVQTWVQDGFAHALAWTHN